MRKGSLSLSINSIVILILAITMLGLGLTFMNKLFGGTVEKFEKITGTIDEEAKRKILDELDTKRVVLNPSEISVSKGGKTTTLLGIKNDVEGDRSFTIVRSVCLPIDATLNSHYCDETKDDLTVQTFENLDLKEGERTVIPIIIESSSQVSPDIYRFTFTIDGGAEFEETATLIVKVEI